MKPNPPDSLFEDVFGPMLKYIAKFVAYVGVLVMVWIAAGFYHREQLRVEVMDAIDTRVQKECQRPDWVKTKLDAREYDVTLAELDVVHEKMDLLVRRVSDLKRKAIQVDEIQQDLLQARSRPTTIQAVRFTGNRFIGGPDPTESFADAGF